MVHPKHKQSSTALKAEVLKMIEDVTIEVETEIASHGEGINTVGTLNQWIKIQNELCKMKSAMSPIEYTPSYTRIISDSWPWDFTLGIRLSELAQKYKRLY